MIPLFSVVPVAILIAILAELSSWSEATRLVVLAVVGTILVVVGTPFALLGARRDDSPGALGGPEKGRPFSGPSDRQAIGTESARGPGGTRDPYQSLATNGAVYILDEDSFADVLVIGKNGLPRQTLRLVESDGSFRLEAITTPMPQLARPVPTSVWPGAGGRFSSDDAKRAFAAS